MTKDPGMAPAREIVGLACLLTVACWLVYLTTAGGTLGSGDAVAMYDEAKAIVDRGAFDVPRDQSTEDWRGPDGRYYTPFGLGQPLYDIPFLVVGRVLARTAGVRIGDPDATPKAVVALGSTVTAAVSVGLTFLLAFRMSGDSRASLVAALALAFGTLVWPYSKFGFNAALATAALTCGVYGYVEGLARRNGTMLMIGGAGFGLALLTRHELAIAGVAAFGYVAWTCREDPRAPLLIAGAAAGISGGGAIAAMHNALRFGTAFSTGYSPALSGGGFAGLTVSPSGSLLLYSPIAVAAVALWRPARAGDPIPRLMLIVAATLFAFYASLDDWLGTRSYGPRYLVPLLPLLVAPLATWWSLRPARRLVLAIVTASVLIQVPGVALDFTRVGIEAGQPPQNARLYSWRWSPLPLTARALVPAVRRNAAYVLTGTAPQPRSSGSLQSRVTFSLDFWWLYLYYLHIIPRAAALAAGVLPLAAAGALVIAVYRRAARCPAAVRT